MSLIDLDASVKSMLESAARLSAMSARQASTNDKLLDDKPFDVDGIAESLLDTGSSLLAALTEWGVVPAFVEKMRDQLTHIQNFKGSKLTRLAQAEAFTRIALGKVSYNAPEKTREVMNMLEETYRTLLDTRRYLKEARTAPLKLYEREEP